MPPTLIDEFSDCASTLRPGWRPGMAPWIDHCQALHAGPPTRFSKRLNWPSNHGASARFRAQAPACLRARRRTIRLENDGIFLAPHRARHQVLDDSNLRYHMTPSVE